MVYRSLFLLFLGSLSCLAPVYPQGTAEDEKRLFAQGPAPAKGDNGKWGFRSLDGSWGVEPKFVEVKPFQEELAAARENTAWGYLDKTGNWKIPPRFSWAGDFSENLAPACEGDRLTGKFGYIDRQGRWAIESDYIWARPFQEGLGAVKDGGKWGFVNPKGKLVVEPDYDQVQSFSGKLAAVQKGGAPGDKETWFYIKPDGEKAFEKKFAWAGSFYDGMARVQTDDRITGKFGYINLKGELIIPAIYDEASDFRGGRAQVRVGTQTKMIDGQGKSSE